MIQARHLTGDMLRLLMNRSIIIFCFLLTSCFSFIDEQIIVIDDELKPYYQSFIEEGFKRNIDFTKNDILLVFSSEMKPSVHGVSIDRKKDLVSEIYINIDTWYFNPLNEYQKARNEVTVFHELGHAFLNRSHTNHCESIMTPYVVCKYDNWVLDKEKMINELFK